ncbi:MAG: TrmH family RNA methyltransferase [Candidatus Taylorbacteria bacterium]
MTQTIILLDNIRSVHNVGSIFRTGECAGVSKIYCIGTTPTPIDRFGRKRKDFLKVSLGSEDLVDWEYLATDVAVKYIRKFKKDGYKIISIEQRNNSVDLSVFKRSLNVVYIFGNEVDGVSKDIIDASDICVEIPMKGEKESLNVSVTVGIVLFKKDIC